MVSGYVKRTIGVILFVVIYFTILINFAPTIVSWTDAFLQQNQQMFAFNTTQLTYQAIPKNATINNVTTTTYTIVQSQKIITINIAPFLEFLIYLTVYFLIPIVGPLLFIFKWSRGG